MEKKVYDSVIIPKDFWGRLKLPDEVNAKLTKNVMKSLDGITAKVYCMDREVFLNKDYGYVWCFGCGTTFDDSLLSRIQNGNWKPLSFLSEHPQVKDIVMDLRNAYNNNPIKFVHFEFENKFYDPCVIGDVVFSREPQKKIDIFLAAEGGEKMAEVFESILNNYNVQI